MKAFFAFLIYFLLLLPAYGATVYQSVDAQGNTVYSDQPSSGGQPVTLAPISIAPTPSMSSGASQPDNSAPQQTIVLYKKLNLASPTNDQTIWDNSGNVPVSVELDPNLAAGDTLQILVDGQVAASSQSDTSFNLTGLDRGTHVLQAQVINNQQKVLKVSSSVTFYMHKAIAACNSPLTLCPGDQCQQEIAYLGAHPICQQNFVDSVAKIYADYQTCMANRCSQLVVLKKEYEAIQTVWIAQIKEAEKNLEAQLKQCTAAKCEQLVQLQERHQAVEQSKAALQAKLGNASHVG